jgi:hypothetical protein
LQNTLNAKGEIMTLRITFLTICFLSFSILVPIANSLTDRGHEVSQQEQTLEYHLPVDRSDLYCLDKSHPGRAMRLSGRHLAEADSQHPNGDDDPSRGGQTKVSMDIKEAEKLVKETLASGPDHNLKVGSIKDHGAFFEAEIITEGDGNLVDRVTIDKNTGRVRPAH